MIFLFVGQPGTGKTLSAIHFIDTDDQFKDRDKFISGIPDLTIEHQPLEDPKQWMDCPDGSVILIDEAWEHFPARSAGKDIPQFIQKLATHRHRGIDIILCTQDAKDLDVFVRRRVNRMYQLQRPGNLPYAKRIQYEGVPDGANGIRPLATEKWMYPKGYFEAYTSTTKDTHKKRFPVGFYFKLSLFILLLIAIPSLIWYGIASFRAHQSDVTGSTTAEQRTGSTGNFLSSATSSSGSSNRKILQTTDDYRRLHTPVDPTDLNSSPLQQTTLEAAEPITYRCISTQDICICHTQQSVRVNIGDIKCRRYATSGYHDPYKTTQTYNQDNELTGPAERTRLAAPAGPSSFTNNNRSRQRAVVIDSTRRFRGEETFQRDSDSQTR